MTTAAERMARINRYELERKPGTLMIAAYSPNITAWVERLASAEELTLAHMAADAEYLPESPESHAMRDAVEFERARRILVEIEGGRD